MIAAVIALPALSAALLLSLGNRTNKFGPWIAIGAATSSFLIGFWQFLQMLARPEEERAVISKTNEIES